MPINLATLYIILGGISFIASVITIIILVKKFINQPAAHGFFSFSDTMASGLLSLGLLLDGVIGVVPSISSKNCYHFKLIFGLFVVAIVTGFFSVLGMAIERFQAFVVHRDHRHITRKFSVAWFLSSWTLSIVFVIILIPQITEHNNIRRMINQDSSSNPRDQVFPHNTHIRRTLHQDSSSNPHDQALHFIPASNIFPTSSFHTAKIDTVKNITQTQYVVPQVEPAADVSCQDNEEIDTNENRADHVKSDLNCNIK